MKATRVFFAGVLGALLSCGALRAQEFELPSELAQGPEQGPELVPVPREVAPPPAPAGSEIPTKDSQPVHRLSNWITYNRPNGCEGPLAHVLPIGTEFYVRSGPSVPLGNEIFGRTLDVGWAIQGGVRALF